MRLRATEQIIIAILFLLMPGLTGFEATRATPQSQTGAPSTSRHFPETGKTVSGRFLQYWEQSGGLTRQGFPISGELQEKSDLDGKSYTVQYFERAVFELHPENDWPYDVLLSQLGTLRYRQKYPQGALGQQRNTDPGAWVFPETGKSLGGSFQTHWQAFGGVAQLGFPISDEFQERSDLDGKTYTVQYFERAIFEWHPENQPPYNVLLSQLGTFRFWEQYGEATPRKYGLVGQGGLGESLDTSLLKAQYESGVRIRLLHLGWDVLQPDGPDSWNSQTAQVFQGRIDAFAALGPDVQLVLDLGVHYPPGWVRAIDPLVDHLGNRWEAASPLGGVNVYWSPNVRRHVADYIRRIFSDLDFKGRLWAVRVGPYGGELLYPHRANGEGGLSFWAFDEHAQAQNPVRGWKPGDPSPNGEAERFYYWYVDNLASTLNFFLGEIRRYFDGYVAPVTPGQGINDRTARELISRNLISSSLSNYGTGNYWQRVFSKFRSVDKDVIHWCSSLGDGSGNDASPNWWDWSSARVQAQWAYENGREIFAENRGRNPYSASADADERITAQWIFRAVKEYDYIGLMWVRQSEMNDPRYTSLQQLKSLIDEHR